MRKILAFALFNLVIGSLFAQSYKTENIHTNTTWLLKDSPFFIEENIIVDTNATLLIEPGSIVILHDYSTQFEIRGTMISKGVSFRTSYSYKNTHGDSVQFQGEYYAPNDYKTVKAEYDKVNYETWFMPGICYSFYQPDAKDSLGMFSGIAVEYLFYTRENQNDDKGPSHVRWYGKLNILNSDKKSTSPMFSYLLGMDMSIERNPNRSFLIPYFGLEFGGLTHKKMGSTVLFVPTFGLHLFSKKNLYINVNGGYYYPISNLEMLRGWYAQAGVNFSLW